jgi:deoxyribonuclease V
MTDFIAILDAAYTEQGAGVGCVLARGWTAAEAAARFTKHVSGAALGYEPGAFYKRELPLLLDMIRGLALIPCAYVIDGYVWLGPCKPGLGARLYDALGRSAPVIGVAKTSFRGDTWSTPIIRGGSSRPLFVTAAGLDGAKAAELIAAMHGDHRIPTLLKLADRLARAAASNIGGQTGQ